MKMFGLFSLVLGLVLSAPSETGSDPSTAANLEFFLKVNAVPIAENPNDNSVKYHVSFDLAVKNNGPKEYKPSMAIQKLWNLTVSQPLSGKKLEWHWTDSSADIKGLGVGEVSHSLAESDSANDAEYIIIATFDQRNDSIARALHLPRPSLNADILFTGRLMGYYRTPDRQFIDDKNCVAPDPELPQTWPSRDARVFFEKFKYQGDDHQVRVGVGDNFAPNYYGRAFAKGRPGPGEYGASKGIYYWDTVDPDPQWRPPINLPEDLRNIEDVRKGHGTIPTDNVACFLSYAHYDAIVPGIMDFHFGVERVRELARFLVGITHEQTTAVQPTNQENALTLHPVQMLAANLMVKTSWARDLDPVPDSAKPQLPFVTKYLQKSTVPTTMRACSPKTDFSLAITNIEDGGFVFPWMQFVRIEAKGCTNGFKPPEVYLCKASDTDPDKFLSNNDPKFCNGAVELSLRPVKKNQPDTPDAGKPTKKELVYQFVPYSFDLAQHMNNAEKKKNPSGPESLLKPGNHYAICTAGPKGIPGNPPYCVRFSVYRPFFQYPNWPAVEYQDWSQEWRSDGEWAHYTNPALYVVKNDKPEDTEIGRTPVVIFGIVGPKMLENVGADNYSWQTVEESKRNPRFDTWNDKYKTQAFVADPIPTLTELSRYFEQNYCFHHHGARFHGIRVLLAQMRPEQARELAERLPKSVRFDVVISAADNALATPNQIVKMEPAFPAETEETDDNDDANLENTACLLEETPKSKDTTQKLLTPTSLIAVPPRHDAAKARWLQARKLHITSDGQSYWKYDLSGERIPIPIPSVDALASTEKDFWKMVYDQVCKSDAVGNCNADDEDGHMTAIQQLALSAIRDKVHADVALLQDKDFYSHGLKDYLAEHCNQWNPDLVECPLQCDTAPEKLDIQQILERIIWKGDFIKTLSVTGSVLKTVLKKSDDFAENEKAGYIPIDETGNDLVTLGIRSDPNHSGEYLINGKPLDPNTLYTIATSDYVALGDTGYPELAKPPVGDPDPPASPDGKVYTVSAVTCSVIRGAESTHFNKTCDLDIPGKDFSDRAEKRTPDDARMMNTNLQKFHAWTFLRHRHGQPTANLPAATGAEAVQEAWQNRADHDGNWNWSFDQLSIGFTGLSHNGTGEEVSRKFSGVLSPAAAAPHSHSWDWDANSKFTFYHPMSDWFVSDILQYSSQFTAQVPGPRSETQLRNQFVLEGGNYFHLHPWRSKELPQLSLALYGHFETSVGSPITNLQIASSPLPLVFDQGRTFALLGRSGLRWEDRKSYVEAGLEGGEILNAIRQFNVLVAPGGPTVPCQLEASVSLTTCINNFNQAHPATPVTDTSTVGVQRRPQDRYGAYWTMRVIVPINDIVSYKFEDMSDYFFPSGGDNSADARFRHQLTHTLKFTVFPNLSFEPTYTLLLYENKLDYNFLLQQQYSIKINYSFNFSNWHERNRQLRYKKP